MAKAMLTRTEGYGLTDTKKAIRIGDTLVTHTATYAWDDRLSSWQLDHAGMRVVHTTGFNKGECFTWNARAKSFVPCGCRKGY